LEQITQLLDVNANAALNKSNEHTSKFAAAITNGVAWERWQHTERRVLYTFASNFASPMPENSGFTTTSRPTLHHALVVITTQSFPSKLGLVATAD
jgi:hypothetical protein